MLFSDLVAVFEKIESQSGRTEITKILSGLLVSLDAQEARFVSYLISGMLYPVYQSTAFNLAEKTLSPLFAEWLVLDANEWRLKVGSSKDLAEAFSVSHKRIEPLPGRSILMIYDALVAIEKTTGSASKEKKAALLKSLLDESSAQESKVIIRIILGVLRLGFSEMTFIDALSWMLCGSKKYSQKIEDAFNVCADIGLITYQLKLFGIQGLDTIVITPGIPVRPAAAERMSDPEAIFNKLGECVSQPKLDGFRLQVHKFVDVTGEVVVKFFSRNLQEKSDVFPELTQAVLAIPEQTLIAEGEAICYDVNTGSFLPFQETAKRGRKHLDEDVVQSHPLKFFVFDILWAQGKSLIDLPNYERRAVLEKVIPAGDVIAPISQVVCSSGAHVDASFLHAISEGLEGIVVKRNDTPYTPGKRNFNWIKLKRKETGELADTVDAVVLGYYFGKGSRSLLGIGAVLLGVYNQTSCLFESIARCGSGPTELEWAGLKELCDRFSFDHKPGNVLVSREHAPDVWVVPEIVVVVRADEITISPLHKAGKTDTELGYALRFPRIMQTRDDKQAIDVTTVDEIKRLFELQRNK
ncbi:ATP-dependent DNA ligase [Candidatus Dependentiae bacterium]|nr:ATP-dependent DNA ligase [Candidatus Dependentiae bacterium]